MTIMITKQEVEAEFRKDLQELLKKYKAEIHLEEISTGGYYTSPQITVYVDGEYDPETLEWTREYCSFSLGSYTSHD